MLTNIVRIIEELNSLTIGGVQHKADDDDITSVQIFVKTRAGKTITLNGLKASDSIDKLKALMFDKEGRRLTLAGKVLQQGTLSDHSVMAESTIDEVGVLTAGAKAIKKEKATKRDKLLAGRSQILGYGVSVQGIAKKAKVFQDFRDKMDTVLTDISSGGPVIRNMMRGSKQAAFQKAMSSTQVDYRMTEIMKILFLKEYNALFLMKQDVDQCVEAMMAITRQAIMVEFGDDAGLIRWSDMSKLLEDDDLADFSEIQLWHEFQGTPVRETSKTNGSYSFELCPPRRSQIGGPISTNSGGYLPSFWPPDVGK
jgi:hypothetical protein